MGEGGYRVGEEGESEIVTLWHNVTQPGYMLQSAFGHYPDMPWLWGRRERAGKGQSRAVEPHSRALGSRQSPYPAGQCSNPTFRPSPSATKGELSSPLPDTRPCGRKRSSPHRGQLQNGHVTSLQPLTTACQPFTHLYNTRGCDFCLQIFPVFFWGHAAFWSYSQALSDIGIKADQKI